MEELLAQVTKRANRYINEMQTRPVSPSPEDIANLKRLDVPLQDQPINPAAVLIELDDIASPATVASTGGRFSLPQSEKRPWPYGPTFWLTTQCGCNMLVIMTILTTMEV